ncbi:hypothetical protein [Pseudaquabacterium pictum]|uniref:Uncharacterized protein n=1 Tax=Pseudaquabacterium pictum TaxID=2315236 RepID=A0A480AMP9_9BURK|nr:hypothetical protein [Rubrivivax pictus]GCL60935.1 hypothetical protein AQPW35_00160 [Rubrivivax pictus]
MAADPAQTAQDFDALRARAIGTLQRLAGQTWTDHNSHDPGITVLEAVCYAITDLAYRSAHPVPDLLASLPVAEGAAPSATQGLFTPAQVLPSGPVTADDLRRLVIDLPGVRNAWVEPVEAVLASHDAAQALLAPAGDAEAVRRSPNVSLLRPRGLLRVSIEKSGLDEDVDGSALVQQAARLLQQWRALGEDVAEVRLLDRLPVALDGSIELAPGADGTETLAAVSLAIAQHLAPPLPFRSLREMLARGWRMDQIFEGPLLRRGFLDPAEWAAAGQRRTAVRVSDLIQVVMAVPGVAAIKRLGFLRDGKPSADWLLPVPADRCASFDMPGSRLQLERGGLRIDHPALRAQARRLMEARLRRSTQPTALVDDALAPPPARPRQVARHLSVQHHMPQVYGVGPAGLSGQEPPERHALARQLKAYLMLFDQLLANQFAQLAQVGRLLSFTDQGEDLRFSQPVPDEGGALQLASVRRLPLDDHAAWLARITDNPWADPEADADDARLAQRHRITDHLLARLGEHWGEVRPVFTSTADADAADTPRRRALRDKQAYLQDYPRLALRRGLGADALAAPDDPQAAPAGLQQRLARLLGLTDSALPLQLVEHILLRPLPADNRQQGPLMRQALSADPFSLQLSLVLPGDDPGWTDADLRQRLAHAVAQETPAHLAVRLLWLDTDALAACHAALARWQALRAAALHQILAGGEAGDAAARQVPLRSARNRVIDALGLGDTYPLTDLRVADGIAATGPGAGLKVAHGRSARIAIDDAEAGVLYSLRAPDGGPLRDGGGQPLAVDEVEGQGGRLLLESPPVSEDIRYRVQARKLRSAAGLPPQPPVLLDQPAPVRVGLDSTLAVLLPDLPLLDAQLANPLPGDVRLCAHGQAVRVQVQASQEGVAYTVVVDGQPRGPAVIGDLDTITLTTPPLTEDCVLAVQAVKRLSASDGGAPETTLLDARAPVAVRADAGRPVVAVPGPVVGFRQGGAALRVQASQASASYQLWVRRVRDAEWQPPGGPVVDATLLQAGPQQPGVAPPAWPAGDQPPPGFSPLGAPVAGTGADLLLPLPEPADDLVCVVQARKQHRSRGDETVATSTGLVQAVLLLVRPDVQPSLQLDLVVPAAGPQQLRVQGGQPGVAYRPTPQPDGKPLDQAAYMHQRSDADASRNKGLGQLVMGVDLVVATDAGSAATLPADEQPPAAPLLDLPVLPAGTALAWQATKVHTGLAVELPLQARLPALPAVRLLADWQVPGSPARVQVVDSLAGTSYQLRQPGQDGSAPVPGHGAALVLDSEPMPVDDGAPLDRWLLLRSTTPAADGQLPVATEQWLRLRLLPRADLPLAADPPSVAAGAECRIVLDSTQPGVLYQVQQRVGDELQPVGEARRGDGGPLSLSTGPVPAEARFQVLAQRADDPAGRQLLAAEVLVTIQPPPGG